MLIHFIHGYYCIYRPWQPLTYLFFPYHCISLIYFSFTMIRMFLYAQIYWLAEFGDVSCLQLNYLRVETLTPTWEDLVGHLSVWSPTKLSVRPECLIVDTLGGICNGHFRTYWVVIIGVSCMCIFRCWYTNILQSAYNITCPKRRTYYMSLRSTVPCGISKLIVSLIFSKKRFESSKI